MQRFLIQSMSNLNFYVMKKIVLLLVGITIVALFFAFPQQTKSEGNNDCIFPKDIWIDNQNHCHVDCPAWSGSYHCWADCYAKPPMNNN